jgi:hypothetical protein
LRSSRGSSPTPALPTIRIVLELLAGDAVVIAVEIVLSPVARILAVVVLVEPLADPKVRDGVAACVVASAGLANPCR